MAGTSSVPTLKSNLVAILQARAALSEVQVSYGPPLPNPGREFIWVGKAIGAQAWAAGGKTKSEEYEQTVTIVVTHMGVDMAAADARCFALMVELENALRTDTTVGGAVTDATVGGFELGEGVDSESRESSLIVRIECRHWI